MNASIVGIKVVKGAKFRMMINPCSSIPRKSANIKYSSKYIGDIKVRKYKIYLKNSQMELRRKVRRKMNLPKLKKGIQLFMTA